MSSGEPRYGDTPPNFVDLVPLLTCRDVPASVRFYTEVLGFEVVDRMDDIGASGFATVRSGAAMIMLASPAHGPSAPQVEGRYSQSAYYLYVDDVSALQRCLTEADWPATECVDRCYGLREFEVVDPEGHVLLFGEDLEEANSPPPLESPGLEKPAPS